MNTEHKARLLALVRLCAYEANACEGINDLGDAIFAFRDTATAKVVDDLLKVLFDFQGTLYANGMRLHLVGIKPRS